jgi:hypothetical protein
MRLINAAFSLAIYYLAISQALPADQVDEYIKEVYPAPSAGH